MSEYDNTNRGAIWPNDKMRPDKQDPQFTGSLNVDGKDYWVSAWKRKADAKDGSPSLSFSVKAKDSQRSPNPANQAPESRPSAPQDEFDSDIPF